jgi:ubiquinone/menaquinone biosynthesis C-methylase UbiE
MTDAMLEKARAHKEQLGADTVEFRKGHIEDLPVESNSVDIIMSNCVINLSPQKKAVFSEALRVLKPGGRIALSDIVTEGEFSEELLTDVEQWSACVTGAIPAEDYIGLMKAAGFTEINVVDKEPADKVVPIQDGMPRIYSARITARKPE